jgi:hypothetical protein
VLGVQKFPFYAWAFVEVDGAVIDDDRELGEVLAPILVIGPPGRQAPGGPAGTRQPGTPGAQAGTAMRDGAFAEDGTA